MFNFPAQTPAAGARLACAAPGSAPLLAFEGLRVAAAPRAAALTRPRPLHPGAANPFGAAPAAQASGAGNLFGGGGGFGATAAKPAFGGLGGGFGGLGGGGAFGGLSGGAFGGGGLGAPLGGGALGGGAAANVFGATKPAAGPVAPVVQQLAATASATTLLPQRVRPPATARRETSERRSL